MDSQAMPKNENPMPHFASKSALKDFLMSFILGIIFFSIGSLIWFLLDNALTTAMIPRMNSILSVRFYESYIQQFGNNEPENHVKNILNFLDQFRILSYIFLIILLLVPSWFFLRIINPYVSFRKLRQNGISIWRIFFWWYVIPSMFIIIFYIAFDIFTFNTPVWRKIIFPFIFGFIIWLFWHEGGIFDDLTCFKKDKLQRQRLFKRISWKSFFQIALRYLFVTLIVYLFTSYGNRWYEMMIGTPSFFEYLYLRPLITNQLFFVLSVLPTIVITLFYGIVRINLSWKERIARLIIPFILFVFIFEYHALAFQKLFKIDIRPFTMTQVLLNRPYDFQSRNIMQELNVTVNEKQNNDTALILLGQKSGSIWFFPLDGDMRNIYNESDQKQPVCDDVLGFIKADCDAKSRTILEQYLINHDHASIYTDSFVSIINESYLNNWEFEKYFTDGLAHYEHGGSILDFLMWNTRLGRMSQYEGYVQTALNTLSNENQFHLGPDGKYRLARLYMHFGETGKAQALVESIMKSNPTWSPKEPVELLEKLESNFTRDGNISGTVTLNGKPVSHLRIALYNYKEVKNRNTLLEIGHIDREKFAQEYGFEVITKALGGVAETDDEGRFTFSHVLSGSYNLVLRFDEDTAESITDVQFNFDTIDIDAIHEGIDVGTITLNEETTQQRKVFKVRLKR